MKALTLTQPWASLIAWGEKTCETRTWGTSLHGTVAIHAAKTIPEEDLFWLHAAEDEAARLIRGLLRSRIEKLADLPLGGIVATADLAACKRIGNGGMDLRSLTEQERLLGNYQAGRYAWFLEDVKAIDPPIPARGHLGLWDWDEREYR